eukprot:1373030-Ditylum_brightwellii.AAC.1
MGTQETSWQSHCPGPTPSCRARAMAANCEFIQNMEHVELVCFFCHLSEVSLVWCTRGRVVSVEEKKPWLVMSYHGGSGGMWREPIP